ncbi:tail fiber domain-containing protein [Crocinitomix catalasitica]|nr:tail fiber domain-containing protein [Crocinitomix catalasitica]
MKFCKTLIVVLACSTGISISYSQVTILNTTRPFTGGSLGWTTGFTGSLEIRNDFTEPIEFFTNNVERMTIRGQVGFNEGFVGFNETNPQFRIDCFGEINLTTSIFTPNTGYRINGDVVLQLLNHNSLFVGRFAGFNSPSAGVAQNTFCGNSSGFSNTLGSRNCFYGFESGFSNIEGRHNSFFGFQAGLSNIGSGVDFGSHNTFIGHQSGVENVSGEQCTFVGDRSGAGNQTGNRNTYVGSQTAIIISIADGSDNSHFGHDAGHDITTGRENVLIGSMAAHDILGGGGNVIAGFDAGRDINNGNDNILLGRQAAQNILNGTANIVGGFQAAFLLNNGVRNVIFGQQAGFNTTGSRNIFSGFRAGFTNLGGSDNVFIGDESGRFVLGSNCTFVGEDAGFNGTTTIFTLVNAAAFGADAVPRFSNDMILGDNFVEVGIGLSNDIVGPGNSLEINEDVADDFATPNTSGGTGKSGLRFRDLTAASSPDFINPGAGVLAVDSLGDVIYVPDAQGGTLGALCPDAPLGDLTADNRVGLNDFALYFEDGASSTTTGINKVSVGYDCGEFRPGKFSVDNVSDVIGTHVETSGLPGVGVAIRALATDNIGTNIGVITLATGSDNFNVGIVSLGLNTSGTADQCYGGRFSGALGNVVNFGLRAGAVSSTATFNVGVGGTANDATTNWGVDGVAEGGDVNIGVRGNGNGDVGSLLNYGVYGCATGPVTSEVWAGFFCGNISVAGTTVWSDENLKEDIVPITADSAEFYINNLNPVTFNFNTTAFPELGLVEGHNYGLIAQDVEAVLPGLVMDATIAAVLDTTGTEITPEQTVKTLNYDGIIGLLTANAKAKNATIDSLEEVNAKQDSLLANFSGRLEDLENCKCVPKPKSQFLGGGDDGTENDNSKAQQIDVELQNIQNVVLNQNVPNPFAEKTTITYSIPDEVQKAQMLFYDAKGSLINSVDIPTRGQGQMNVFGEDLSSGIYSYTLVTDGGVVLTKKMVKAK